MKFAALVSGGKDSLYSILECIRNGHELVCCVHLGAPLEVEEESFMYQTAASNVIPILVQECLGVPLILQQRVGKSVNQSLVYENCTDEDEVEDMYLALKKTKDEFPMIEAVSSGAILSTYQRVRIESVCNRLNLASLSYLWRMYPQRELLEKMLQEGIEAVLVKTACPPCLVPSRHLKQTLGNLYYSGLFHRLHEKFKFHYCGEGGEYESLVVDCPIYERRLIIDESEIIVSDDGVGELIIKKCHSEEKSERPENRAFEPCCESSKPANTDEENITGSSDEMRLKFFCLPHVKRATGGLIHFSEIISQTITQVSSKEVEGAIAVKEALEIFELIRYGLLKYGCNSRDVIFVHLYLSEMSHFSNINKHYKRFFGTLLPPSRSCVAVGSNLPGGRRVMLDCFAQIGSGAFMRKSNEENNYTKAAISNENSLLRQVLHVQSISYWAPVCVGPYSQVNTLRSGIHFIAGQIGLDPPTMKLKEGWIEQLKQCWTNLARILDALDGGSLDNLMSCLLYVSPKITNWDLLRSICSEMVSKTNGHVVPGAVDSLLSSSEMYGGYEDEGTWREMTKQEGEIKSDIPFLMVVIPEMPVGALVEIEAIAVTARAASSLGKKIYLSEENAPFDDDAKNLQLPEWDIGHDFPIESQLQTSNFNYYAATLCMGFGCAAMSTVVASPSEKHNILILDPDMMLSKMLYNMRSSLANAFLSPKEIFHVRLYYAVGEDGETAKNDGYRWRSSLATALAREIPFLSQSSNSIPAMSIIPVLGIKFVHNQIFESPLVALQVLAIDPAHLETELWINKCRE